MLTNIRFLLIFAAMIGSKIHASEDPPPPYLKYVDEISKEFGKEVERELKLIYIGGGGGMPKDVEEVSISFLAYRTASIEEARSLEVRSIEKFLNSINSHKGIKTFLREYPFPAKRAEVSISFRKKNDEHQTNHSISYVTQINNKISYFVKDPTKGRLVRIHEEPYEEALKIVQNQSPPEKQ
ncbi:MAG: hypothetical protein K1000chlam2_01188 [Chlamydiae bacterium]|nr:hypothetical protein [Chlamydiota bacterium]